VESEERKLKVSISQKQTLLAQFGQGDSKQLAEHKANENQGSVCAMQCYLISNLF